MDKEKITDIIKGSYVIMFGGSIYNINQDTIDELYNRYKSAEDLENKTKKRTKKKSEVEVVTERVVSVIFEYKYENRFKGVM